VASVTFSFNLDPVVSATSQRASTVAAESSASVAAKYQAAQPSAVQGQHSMAGMNSPACDGSTCFIVHSDGPGVTTLSLGEEDGGGVGEFLTLPVVDGVEFLEPPAMNFADAGQFDITTLAIGEEDGGIASAAPEIGSMEPVYSAPEIGQQLALQPIPLSKPEMSVTTQTVQIAEVQSQLPPIETTPIIEPRMKPETTASAMAPIAFAPAATPLPAGQVSSVTAPRAKPTDFAFDLGPLPAMKPAAVGGTTAAIPETAITQPAAPAEGNFVSVGDYDSYIASLSGGDTAVSDTASVSAPATAAPQSPVAPAETTVTYSPPPPAPDTAVTYVAPPAAPSEAVTYVQPAPTQPVAAEPEAMTPRMKPATFTTPGPASLPPIETVPIETSPAITTNPVEMTLQPATGFEPTFNFATVDAPMPAGKPEGSGLDTPRLSEEDFRITTLALGEEDAGGG